MVVDQLVSSGNLEHFYISIANMVPDKVPLNQEVLGTVGDALLGSKQQCPIAILKDAATSGRLKIRWQGQSLACRFHQEGCKEAIEMEVSEMHNNVLVE